MKRIEATRQRQRSPWPHPDQQAAEDRWVRSEGEEEDERRRVEVEEGGEEGGDEEGEQEESEFNFVHRLVFLLFLIAFKINFKFFTKFSQSEEPLIRQSQSKLTPEPTIPKSKSTIVVRPERSQIDRRVDKNRACTSSSTSTQIHTDFVSDTVRDVISRTQSQKRKAPD